MIRSPTARRHNTRATLTPRREGGVIPSHASPRHPRGRDAGLKRGMLRVQIRSGRAAHHLISTRTVDGRLPTLRRIRPTTLGGCRMRGQPELG